MLERERAADPPVFNGQRCLKNSHHTVCGGKYGRLLAKELAHGCHDKDRILGDLAWCPSVYITRDPKSIVGRPKALVMSWSAHMSFEEPGQWPLTASHLRRRLAELSDIVGRFMTLAIQPGIQGMPELRCFDPNDCDCVYFEGSEDVDWRPYRPLQQEVGPPFNRDGACSKCHLNPERRLVQMPYRRRPSSLTTDASFDRISSLPIPPCRRHEKDGCFKARRRHRTRTWYAAPEGKKPTRKPSEYAIDVRSCHSYAPCMRVEYLRTLVHPLPLDDQEANIPASWYQSLDPDSYSLTSDAEEYGMYWCREPGCYNYYRASAGFDRFLSGFGHLSAGEYLGHIRSHYIL